MNRAGATIYDWRHYLAVVQRKPGALRKWLLHSSSFPMHFGPCSNICSRSPAVTARWSTSWPLVLQHDEQAVLTAVDMALRSGVPTKTHVLNLLHRLVDGKSFTPPTLDALRH